MKKDALKVYRAKRDFKLTKEPSGRTGRKPTPALSYLIQKHAARRLHYDFRLELDGVLKSWAVTRGPSLDPKAKRLAVHVEDHPYDYGTFEGTIPAGQYGGGTVMLWDRGTWEPLDDPHAGLAKGHMRFLLKGERLQGEWHLIQMKGRMRGDAKHDNWLLVKGDDEYANSKSGDAALERYQTSVVTGRKMEEIAGGKKTRAMKPTKARKRKIPVPSVQKKHAASKILPSFVQPQLATLVSVPPTGEAWVHEIKFDGYRALARIDGGRIQLLTRNNNDWTAKFQPIADALATLNLPDAFLDGEIVAVNAQGEMTFTNLQQTLSGEASHNLHYYIFDLLFEGEEDARLLPLLERKKRLRRLLPKKNDSIHFSDHFQESGSDVLTHSCQIGLEGIISKQKNAAYISGRHEGWLKSKCLGEQEMAIGGFTYQPKHPDKLGALLLGYYEEKVFHFAGKVGTGFSDKQRDDLLKKLKKRGQTGVPFESVPGLIKRGVQWVRPELVGQIAFTEWTKDGHLRHPTFKGLREDKKAVEVRREVPKRVDSKIAEHPALQKSAETALLYPITHSDKILYPDDGISKGDIAAYYEMIAPVMLPFIICRPLSLMRCPNGIGAPGFFQRHAGDKAPKQIKNVTIDIAGKNRPYIFIEDIEGLMALVQLGSLELHNWPVHTDRLDNPDMLIFDFDPGQNVPWKKVQQAASEVRQHLEDLKLKSFLKATGGHGLHVVVPLGGQTTWQQLRNFSEKVAAAMAADNPDLYTVNSRKAERLGRIYIDYLRNNKGASAVVPYSTRARPGAPVSMPLSWPALAKLKAGNIFNIANAAKQINAEPNPWPDFDKLKQLLPVMKTGR